MSVLVSYLTQRVPAAANTGRDCFQKHVAHVASTNTNFTPKRKRAAALVDKAKRVKEAQEQAQRTVQAARSAAEDARLAAEALNLLMEP
ncbi:hypothetical protein CYMTET_14405 [Cymbomonas tetramitiformis]|uniref:Uncharacterized protein n=1 Tax=Cymbomonas tetramitiformis TaxID=36881 RepID=A0AAE0GHK5_9CHLO|nr:hypothetical protein CYMTET_14405 [Cymbomonas tetramitiformis]